MTTTSSKTSRLSAVASDLAFGLWERGTRLATMTPTTRRARRFGSFGDGSVLCFPQIALYNEHAIHIGRNTAIGPMCSLTCGLVPGQDLLNDRMLVIGDDCVIGRGTSIAAHLDIVIADGVYFGPNVFITDHNHSNELPEIPIGRQSTPEEPVRVGKNSWLGTGVVVTPGVTIGEGVIVGANSIVTQDIPDGTIAAGAPARPLRSSATL